MAFFWYTSCQKPRTRQDAHPTSPRTSLRSVLLQPRREPPLHVGPSEPLKKPDLDLTFHEMVVGINRDQWLISHNPHISCSCVV